MIHDAPLRSSSSDRPGCLPTSASASPLLPEAAGGAGQGSFPPSFGRSSAVTGGAGRTIDGSGRDVPRRPPSG